MRILVADDDRVSLRVLASTLTRWGYQVDTASDGTAAWNALRDAGEPTIAFLDWMMPGVDGVDICGLLRGRSDGPPVFAVLLTGRDTDEDRATATGAGADAYVVKPFDPEELKGCLESGLKVLEERGAEDTGA